MTDSKTAAAYKPGIMDLCVCRSCGDLAPDAIKEIDRLIKALTEVIQTWEADDGRQMRALGDEMSAIAWRALNHDRS